MSGSGVAVARSWNLERAWEGPLIDLNVLEGSGQQVF
jgi:hypothetical protein